MKLRKEKIDYIYIIIICIIIIFSSLLIGAPTTNNFLIITMTINSLALMYIVIIYKIDKKYKYLNSTISIAIILLTISSIIPVIFKTYISLSGTIKSFIIYVSLFSIFLLIKENEIEEKWKYIDNAIIISAIISCIIGLDNLTINSLDMVLTKFLGNVKINNPDNRLFANFGYANAFAIYISTALFLEIKKCEKETNIINKIRNYIIILFFGICILLSFSRGTWLVLGAIIIINMFINKDLYKKYLKTILATVIIGIIIFMILLPKTQPLKLFESVNDKQEYTQNMFYLGAQQEKYTIKIEIDSKVQSNNEIAYIISINEKNKYNDTLMEHNIELGNFSGTKIVEFTKQEDTQYFTITYKKIIEGLYEGLTINKLIINEKEVKLDYKYLPRKLIEKIQNTNMKTMAIWERRNFIVDTIKLLPEYGLLGAGGNAWKELQYQVQEYHYFAHENHCYILEIFLEFGLMGFISILIIYGSIVAKLKNNSLNNKYILVLLMLLIHSCFDFSLSFGIIQIECFILLGLIDNKQFKNINFKFLNIFVVILITVGTIISIQDFVSYTYFTIRENKTSQTNKMIKHCQVALKIYPLNYNARFYIINYAKGEILEENISKWLIYEPYSKNNLILSKLSSNKLTNRKMEIIYNQFSNKKLNHKKDIAYEFERYNLLEKITNEYEYNEDVNVFLLKKFEILLQQEKDNIRTEIEDKENRITNMEKEYYLEKLMCN